MNHTDAARIGGFQFLGFVQAGPRKRAKVVAEQRELYLNPQGPAWIYYGQLFAGFRSALNAPDPRSKLDLVVDRAAAADPARGRAYAEARDGFLRLLPRGATGVPSKQPSWRDGELTVELRNMLGLRLRDGKLLYVAPYVKGPELTQDDADVLLYMMEETLEQALPGGTPVVWDVRRAKPFKLRQNTNRQSLGCHVRGQAAAYMVAWRMAA
ncbi:hypothetical protein [Amycolatopsis thermophila]|uniref:Uncharacterized protein n=1 Tax=Amycolatopsis thermophila TaxID=206084 RepID=A0ABU0ET89_9PSEU|nr:hypothetical protein [Amycolatopsis thermophila]MDQ0378186.1 hypothetical protein [Amycolatopsis thermophila]